MSPITLALIGPIAAALLAGLGYAVKSFIGRDRTNILVDLKEIRQELALVGPLPTHVGHSVYCEAVGLQLAINHNLRGCRPVTVSEISFEALLLAVNAETEERLHYEIDALDLKGAGIKEVEQYEFSLDGRQVIASYRKTLKDPLRDVEPSNILRSDEGAREVTIGPSGDFSRFSIDASIVALAAGVYKARFIVHYSLAGEPKQQKTDWIYIAKGVDE